MNKVPSINDLTQPIVQQLINSADALRLGIEQDSSGAIIIDAGTEYSMRSDPKSPNQCST